MDEEKLSQLKKLSPFVVRAGLAETGRQRLLQHRNKLSFVLITEDISENSREETLKDFPCPIYQALTMSDMSELFHLQGTKVVGFRRNVLSTQVQRCFQGCLIKAEPVVSTPMPEKPRVVIFGASGIGMRHALEWKAAGAEIVGFVGSSSASIAVTASRLSEALGYRVEGSLDPEGLLASVAPNIVDVCLPTALHYEGCYLALRLGFHVLCETPFLDFNESGLSRKRFLKQAETLVSLAARHKRLLAMAVENAIPEMAQGRALRTAAQEENLALKRSHGTEGVSS